MSNVINLGTLQLSAGPSNPASKPSGSRTTHSIPRLLIQDPLKPDQDSVGRDLQLLGCSMVSRDLHGNDELYDALLQRGRAGGVVGWQRPLLGKVGARRALVSEANAGVVDSLMSKRTNHVRTPTYQSSPTVYCPEGNVQ